MEISDQPEGHRDRNRMGVDGSVRQLSKRLLQHASQGTLAEPAKGKARHGDAQLHAVEHLVEFAVELPDGAGADALGLDELLDPGIADADQRELGGHEERIGGNQQQHGQNSQ